MATLSGDFSFVLIPADEGSPIEQREGNKSGGLSDDYLINEAKGYFHAQRGGDAQAAQFDNLTPEEKKGLAEQIREQFIQNNPKANKGFADMEDDKLIELVRSTHTSASCDITALTVPTKANKYYAVSMYCGDEAKRREMPFNPRATTLLQACGHAPASNGENDGKPPGIYGDVFVGRCFDKEETDVWERSDFTIQDVTSDSEWCLVAKTKGGGGGRGGTTGAHSLSGVMTKALEEPLTKENLGYVWTQNEEEVEFKFAIATGTKAKYVKVNFGRDTLKVTVAGQTLLNGTTGGLVCKDECTYTVQDTEDKKGRELCVTLGKGNTIEWPFPMKSRDRLLDPLA